MFMFRNVQSLKHTKSKIVVFAGFCFNITFLDFEFICIYTICVWTRLLNVICVGRRVDCFCCNQSNLLIVRLYLWVPPPLFSMYSVQIIILSTNFKDIFSKRVEFDQIYFSKSLWNFQSVLQQTSHDKFRR